MHPIQILSVEGSHADLLELIDLLNLIVMDRRIKDIELFVQYLNVSLRFTIIIIIFYKETCEILYLENQLHCNFKVAIEDVLIYRFHC